MIGSFRFAPFHDRMLLTNDSGRYCFLSKDEFATFVHRELPRDSDAWQRLKAQYFCTDESSEVYYRMAEDHVRNNHAYLFSPTSLFIFALTNRCNNGCVYCQANGGTRFADMNAVTARKAIDCIAVSPSKHITIEFQGGEPLLCFPIICEIVEYANERLKDKEVSFSLVSNLGLLTEEMADYIVEHNISVSTSLDGPEWLHNANRPCGNRDNSYLCMLRGKVLIEQRGASVGAIQTTTRASLPYAKEIVDTYYQLGFKSIFLRPLTRLGAAGRVWQTIGYSPDEFLMFYRDGIRSVLALNKKGIQFSERYAALFMEKLIGKPSPNYMELRSPCGAAIGQMAFTASGDVYTCDEGRMLAEMGDYAFRLGNVFTGDYNQWINSSVCKAVCSSSLLETLPGCCDCVYQPYCGVCPVVNYALEGSLVSSTPNNDRCRIYHGMLDLLFEMLLEDNDEVVEQLYNWTKQE